MPKRLHNALNPKQIATLPPGSHADGRGLELRVDAKGARRWVVRLKVDGKMTARGLGSYPNVSLADARKGAAAAVRDAKAVAAASVPEPEPDPAPVPTFDEAARMLIEARRPTWSNPKHAQQWRNTLYAYCHEQIGDKPVDQITTADVANILDPIWTKPSRRRPAGSGNGWRPYLIGRRRGATGLTSIQPVSRS